jgi:hypothetical protein
MSEYIKYYVNGRCVEDGRHGIVGNSGIHRYIYSPSVRSCDNQPWSFPRLDSLDRFGLGRGSYPTFICHDPTLVMPYPSPRLPCRTVMTWWMTQQMTS